MGVKADGLVSEDLERGMQVFDEFLTQLGEDVAAYVRTVCHTIVLTVPKAIIHCQVGTATRAMSAQYGASLQTPGCCTCPVSFLPCHQLILCSQPSTIHPRVSGPQLPVGLVGEVPDK